MAGLGVAFILARTVAAEVKQGRMIVLPVMGLPIVCKWYVLRAKAKHLLPAGIALWEFLVQHGGRYAPDYLAPVGAGQPIGHLQIVVMKMEMAETESAKQR